ncbi:MAG TPA: DUF1801 domain-containing protein [Longimicrobium sp.]|nr:DUF1801 domain-containing protein [Longimicrobium sp.]
MSDDDAPEARLEAWIARYSPEVAGVARAVLAKMRERLPGAVQMVYDNYNALAITFGPGERASEAVFSVALYPRRVSLFFLHGAGLPDPQQRLQGSGNQVRSVVLRGADDLDDPALRALMDAALRRAPRPIDPAHPGRIVIKSVSARQRPRRPDGDPGG